MYPHDNIFNIYLNIGRKLPFVVKRLRNCDPNSEWARSNMGRTFLVERVQLRNYNGLYGHAFGKCFQDGEEDNTYMELYHRSDETGDGNLKPDEIPCAGCGGWILIDVPGVDSKDFYEKKKSSDILEFGKYKGLTIKEIAKKDAKYIFWLINNKEDLNIDLYDLFDLNPNEPNSIEKLKVKINEADPPIGINDIITIGKYKGKTYKDVSDTDPEYFLWAIKTWEQNYNIEEFENEVKKIKSRL